MERWSGRVALVTGASMGIGAAIVRKLVTRGIRVVACARSLDKLQALSDELGDEKGKVLPIQCDLQDEEQILDMFSKVKTCWGGVDICINNAGLCLDSPIIEGDSESWRKMWQVNVMAVCLCTRESVRSMREQGVDDGHIININSLSGHRVGKQHFYSATKFALQSLTEGVRWELRAINSHIKISEVSPGLVRSHFHAAMLGDEARAAEIYTSRQPLEAQDIADSVIFTLSTPPHVQIHEIMMRPTEQIP